jgi:hypothetical protein
MAASSPALQLKILAKRVLRRLGGLPGQASVNLESLHPLFDPQWYVDRHPEARNDPWGHFHTLGWKAGYDPSPLFVTNWYLAQNADVRHAGVNPLLHFIQAGSSEGRSPNPVFDPRWYQRQVYATIKNDDLWGHFLNIGGLQGLDPHPLFSSKWYRGMNEDVVGAGNPLTHYLYWGGRESRDPRPIFDTCWYRAQAELADGVNPLVHYICEGGRAGLNPNPIFRPTGISPAIRMPPTGATQPRTTWRWARSAARFRLRCRRRLVSADLWRPQRLDAHAAGALSGRRRPGGALAQSRVRRRAVS